MRLGRAIWITAAVLLWALPVQASAQELAASCPGPPDNFLTSGSGGNGRFAQTFTTSITGVLTIAQFDVSKAGTPGDYRLDINSVDGAGVPTNTVLASTSVSDAAVPAGPSLITGSFANPAAVTAGQQYALVVTRPGSSNLAIGFRNNDVCPGQPYTSSSQVGAFFLFGLVSDFVFNVFVTQESAPSDTTAPETTITKHPKTKTKKKTATFEFTSSEPGSTFECKLDDNIGFAPCTSPQDVKVGKGKHSFSVRATDLAGNIDQTPATFDWKVKKKKKK